MIRTRVFAKNARSILQLRLLSAGKTSLTPTEIWRRHEKYDPNSVLKSGILQMTPSEAENVDTSSPEMRLLMRTLSLFVLISVSYAFAMLGLSLLQGDESGKEKNRGQNK